jgi:hypothetical protein
MWKRRLLPSDLLNPEMWRRKGHRHTASVVRLIRADERAEEKG